MDSLSVVVQQTDEKVTQLKEYLADGRCENFEDFAAISRREVGKMEPLRFWPLVQDRNPNSHRGRIA